MNPEQTLTTIHYSVGSKDHCPQTFLQHNVDIMPLSSDCWSQFIQKYANTDLPPLDFTEVKRHLSVWVCFFVQVFCIASDVCRHIISYKYNMRSHYYRWLKCYTYSNLQTYHNMHPCLRSLAKFKKILKIQNKLG